jgi:hypothetical protein
MLSTMLAVVLGTTIGASNPQGCTPVENPAVVQTDAKETAYVCWPFPLTRLWVWHWRQHYRLAVDLQRHRATPTRGAYSTLTWQENGVVRSITVPGHPDAAEVRRVMRQHMP